MPHFSRFPFLHCLLIDSFCHSPWISDSSPSLLGPRYCLFYLFIPILSQHFLSYSIGWVENFPFFILLYLPYNCISSSTYATLYPLCSSIFCFSVSPIPCLFATSTPHITQLLFTQETLPPVLLSFCSLIVTSPALHKSDHLPFCHPFFHAHPCSPWGKLLCPTMFFYPPPHVLQQCRFFFSPPFSTFWTLLFFVSFFPTLEALWPFLHDLLSPHLPHSTLHYSTT